MKNLKAVCIRTYCEECKKDTGTVWFTQSWGDPLGSFTTPEFLKGFCGKCESFKDVIVKKTSGNDILVYPDGDNETLEKQYQWFSVTPQNPGTFWFLGEPVDKTTVKG